ncbi:MAG: 5-methyltetrahydropteroyltriglutamate--homocysteine S-methyltransferase, partial [Achromobacter sp.]
MTTIHNLGFPRIGAQRELKRAVEAYWAGKQTAEELEQTGRDLRAKHWKLQAAAGLKFVPVGDFAWYDQILEWTALLGAVPARFGQKDNEPVTLDTLFRMGRGRAPSGKPAAACEMTKWFDTNYHYIVPELVPGQTFRIARESLFEQAEEAQAQGYAIKPVIPGPLTWLYQGKGDAFAAGAADAGKLQLLAALLPVYLEVLARFARLGVQWVQIDEPILALDLPQAWRDAFKQTYDQLSASPVKLLVATYFDGLKDNLPTALGLPVAGLHVDLVRAPEQLAEVVSGLGAEQVLSAGVINGRNIWRTDLDAAIATLTPIKQQLGDRLWLAPSCSLLHVPVDLAYETELDAELKSWLSFAAQKLEELSLLGRALDSATQAAAQDGLAKQRAALAARRSSARIHNPAVGQRMA